MGADPVPAPAAADEDGGLQYRLHPSRVGRSELRGALRWGRSRASPMSRFR
jgi:hypothetical protein